VCGGIAASELQKLRDENAFMQAEMKRCHDEDAKIRAERMATAEKNHCLTMMLADYRERFDIAMEQRNRFEDEVDFCKRELKRHDPRLAKARWGI